MTLPSDTRTIEVRSAAGQRMAEAHADYVSRMRAAGAFACTHPPVITEHGKTLLVGCDQCAPHR